MCNLVCLLWRVVVVLTSSLSYDIIGRMKVSNTNAWWQREFITVSTLFYAHYVQIRNTTQSKRIEFHWQQTYIPYICVYMKCPIRHNNFFIQSAIFSSAEKSGARICHCIRPNEMQAQYGRNIRFHMNHMIWSIKSIEVLHFRLRFHRPG